MLKRKQKVSKIWETIILNFSSKYMVMKRLFFRVISYMHQLFFLTDLQWQKLLKRQKPLWSRIWIIMTRQFDEIFCVKLSQTSIKKVKILIKSWNSLAVKITKMCSSKFKLWSLFFSFFKKEGAQNLTVYFAMFSRVLF